MTPVTHLLADGGESSCSVNGCPFSGFSGDMAEDCSQGLELGTSPDQLVVGGLP